MNKPIVKTKDQKLFTDNGIRSRKCEILIK